jgi:hypothetical protein
MVCHITGVRGNKGVTVFVWLKRSQAATKPNGFSSGWTTRGLPLCGLATMPSDVAPMHLGLSVLMAPRLSSGTGGGLPAAHLGWATTFCHSHFPHVCEATEETQGPCQAQLDAGKGGGGEKARLHLPKPSEWGGCTTPLWIKVWAISGWSTIEQAVD